MAGSITQNQAWTQVWSNWPGAKANHVPQQLGKKRLKQWCIQRTIRDQRLATAQGMPMAQRGLKRRLARRVGRGLTCNCR